MVVRGRGLTLEIALSGSFADAEGDAREQLAARPEFFRGSRAAVDLSAVAMAPGELRRIAELFAEYEIGLDGVHGPVELRGDAEHVGIPYLGPALLAESPGERKRPAAAVALSEGARSLVADFAGARADLATRRTARVVAGIASPASVSIPAAAFAPVGPSTLYHRGTLRGGQSLHNLGNIVVIGDVNPGAELIASGDIVVFGALRGVAHAGAQGDRSARVIALELEPTQLRIATLIAADAGASRPTVPEQASIVGDRITVVPQARAESAKREGVR